MRLPALVSLITALTYSDALDQQGEAQCKAAVVNPSPITHHYAEDGLEVDHVSFSSCYLPEDMDGSNFWADVRSRGTDLWLWLGDNMYMDGNDMDAKRTLYNAARDEESYVENGPVKEGSKIPVLATWDDHDCCSDNDGNNFPCLAESQQEFVKHFNVPVSDPVHPDNSEYHLGVYNSRMFLKPGTEENGIHAIMLDARTGRDPTYSYKGACRGADSQMLSDQQWTWLENELSRESEIKIIASGVQVLPPTDQTKDNSEFCSDDSHSGGQTTTFSDSIAAVGEDAGWYGTSYETWAEIPKERLRLLGLAQKAVNEGKTKVVIFVSGDQHWAELMAKKMPQSEAFGPSQTLYEVTASGVPRHFNYDIVNSNRLRDRSCDTEGSGPYNQACVFPFRYNGVTYEDCTTANSNVKWCSTKTDATNAHMSNYWGNCDSRENELAQETFSDSSKTCTLSDYHICYALGNYGFIEVDFEAKKVKMGIKTPVEEEQAFHTVSYQ